MSETITSLCFGSMATPRGFFITLLGLPSIFQRGATSPSSLTLHIPTNVPGGSGSSPEVIWLTTIQPLRVDAQLARPDQARFGAADGAQRLGITVVRAIKEQQRSLAFSV